MVGMLEAGLLEIEACSTVVSPESLSCHASQHVSLSFGRRQAVLPVVRRLSSVNKSAADHDMDAAVSLFIPCSAFDNPYSCKTDKHRVCHDGCCADSGLRRSQKQE